MGSYFYFKAFHLIFMVAWFAGLFYIFRLFVYHSQNRNEENIHQLFIKMERKLLSIIMYPALALTAIFGFLMIYINPALLAQKWLHYKFVGVFFLIAYHLFSEYVQQQFRKRNFFLSEKQCRLLNEVPTFCLVAIILLAILKPWSSL